MRKSTGTHWKYIFNENCLLLFQLQVVKVVVTYGVITIKCTTTGLNSKDNNAEDFTLKKIQ